MFDRRIGYSVKASLPDLWKVADSVGGQLRGDKECPFIGVTSSGRVRRKVPESDARSVAVIVTRTAKKKKIAQYGHSHVIQCSVSS